MVHVMLGVTHCDGGDWLGVRIRTTSVASDIIRRSLGEFLRRAPQPGLPKVGALASPQRRYAPPPFGNPRPLKSDIAQLAARSRAVARPSTWVPPPKMGGAHGARAGARNGLKRRSPNSVLETLQALSRATFPSTRGRRLAGQLGRCRPHRFSATGVPQPQSRTPQDSGPFSAFRAPAAIAHLSTVASGRQQPHCAHTTQRLDCARGDPRIAKMLEGSCRLTWAMLAVHGV